MNPEVLERIRRIVEEHPVVLFMKGTPELPQCGYSARAVRILEKLGVPFHAVDVLKDPEIREGVKLFGNWPTLPQLYVRGTLIGGSDIMLELYEKGELQSILAQARAPSNLTP